MNPDIFKAYDVRGKVGTELTAEVTHIIGRALADWLPTEGPVAVGRDMRSDSEELAASFIEGLRLQGREVIDIGLVSSDMIYFAVGSLGIAGGAMVTASHNPGAYNGIKLCREEARPIGIDTGLAEIREASLKDEFVAAKRMGKVSQRDVRDDWITHVLSFVHSKNWPEYNIAIDAGNGMLGVIAPLLTERVPQLYTEEMFYELDGAFPNHPANPLLDEGIVDLQQKIREKKLDFGIAFDGDGDRAVLVDEKGERVSGTVMTAILADYFLTQKPGSTILYDLRIGHAVRDLISQKGGKGVRTRVGHSFIKAAMREHDAVFAGELSSHFYFRDNWSADSGLLAAMVAIQVLSESGKSLSELAQDYKTYVSINETNFEVENKNSVLARLKKEFSDGEQDELDGLTVGYEGAWFNVRPSNTEPLLRLNMEAKDQKTLDELLGKVVSIIAQ